MERAKMRLNLWEAGLAESKRMREIREQQDNQIYNEAINDAANKIEALGSFAIAHEVRKMKK